MSNLLHPLVTVDIALFTVESQVLKVLLVKRLTDPFAGQWSLPGGVLRPHEDATLCETVRRVMRDKVRVELPLIEEVGTFNGATRDTRDWSISVLHLALLPMDQVEALVGERVLAVEWVDALAPDRELAFDHAEMLERAIAQLRCKCEAQLPLHMLPAQFTLTQLQRVCEAILGKPLDKSAFRRRLKDLHARDMEEVPGAFERGLQRPAQLWRPAMSAPM